MNGIRYLFAALALCFLIFGFGPACIVGLGYLLLLGQVVQGAGIICAALIFGIAAVLYMEDYEYEPSDR